MMAGQRPRTRQALLVVVGTFTLVVVTGLVAFARRSADTTIAAAPPIPSYEEMPRTGGSSDGTPFPAPSVEEACRVTVRICTPPSGKRGIFLVPPPEGFVRAKPGLSFDYKIDTTRYLTAYEKPTPGRPTSRLEFVLGALSGPAISSDTSSVLTAVPLVRESQAWPARPIGRLILHERAGSAHALAVAELDDSTWMEIHSENTSVEDLNAAVDAAATFE
jgi:hypothetical protein